jgi:chaperonin GroES
MTKLTPRNDNVLLLPDDPPDKIGRFFLPQSYATMPTRGTIVAVGPGYILADGTRSKIDLEPDQRVEFRIPPEGCHSPDIDGDTHFVINEVNIVAVVEDEPQASMAMPEEEDETDEDEIPPELREQLEGATV